ncbi:S1 family peptidase [Amycolatopsis sp. CA-230715]|uniref:S1 family peptidase n=1 Tax=Amycolatopsis sp. CA-230715 TaxID=2745196 RepID=UPI001C024F77|nr:trypsin-like serine protease [Amycolatopsis sp. CA-230715]QWF83002.1 hypothetical protein HUW46_06441 [Amycolatopsis sp. CA-230715]
MKTRTWWRGAAVAAAFLSSAAVAAPAQAIINGTVATEDYSFVTSIQREYKGDPTTQWCGGALVAPTLVVTAAHCVTKAGTNGAPYTPVDPGIYQVRVGSNDRTTGGETAKVAGFEIIPGYVNSADRNDGKDIALVRLDHAVSKQPIPLAGITPAPGNAVRLIGWGYTDIKQNNPTQLPKQLHRLDLPVVLPSTKQCVQDPATGSDAYGIRKGDFCAESRDHVSGSCGGDSGSPVLQLVYGRFELAGVQSRAPGDICGQTPDINTSAPAYRDWITSVTG